ncbi:MAG: hypothetical protein V5A31_06135 [Haloferacaceae archaeon]
MQSRTMVVAVALVAVVGVTGASAFTTATVARDAQIDVANDENGAIGLTAGSVSGVSQNGSGALNLALGQEGTAQGLNTEATFAYGDTSSPTTTFAFEVTNNDSQAHDIDLSYAFDGNDPNTNAVNVEFVVYDSSGGASVATASEDSTATIAGVGGGVSHYVVVQIDTTGVASSDDLSGTLEVSAT